MEIVLYAAVLGAVVGFILALTGAGGGILAVPALVFGLHLSMAQAVPVGVIAVGMAAAVGAVLGLREGIVRYRAAALIGIAGIVLAPLGVWLGQRLPNAPLMIGFAGVLAFTAWRMYRQSRRPVLPNSIDNSENQPPCVTDPGVGQLIWTLPCARALAFTGMISGLLSGMFGVGGGFVIVPALTRYTNLVARSVLATSLAVIAMVSLSALAAAAMQGAIAWTIALPFGAGAVAALLLGRLIATRVAGARLQQGFAVISAGVALMLLWRGVHDLVL